MKDLDQVKSWWARRWIEALEAATDTTRAQKGRVYLNADLIEDLELWGGEIRAQVREPLGLRLSSDEQPIHQVSLKLEPLDKRGVHAVLSTIVSQSAYSSALLTDNLPEPIESAVQATEQSLFGTVESPIQARCTCADWNNFCKHSVGLGYQIATFWDYHPRLFLKFRGVAEPWMREALQFGRVVPMTTIAKAESKLDEIALPQILPDVVETLFHNPEPDRETFPPVSSAEHFWCGEAPIPKLPALPQSDVPAVLIRHAGSAPAFWDSDTEFVELMTQIYQVVRDELA
jgi:uncharacterized Zn finger protein